MSEADTIESLRSRGYALNFAAVDDGLRCSESGVVYPPEECTIVETHRFEGCSNVSDEALVCAIETDDRHCGVMITAFGPYAPPEVGLLMDRIRLRRH